VAGAGNGGSLFGGGGAAKPNPGGLRLLSVDLNHPVKPVTSDQTIQLDAAKNEWASFTLQIDELPAQTNRNAWSLRVNPLTAVTGDAPPIAPGNFLASQVLPMPVDVNRAGYVRHTGLSVATRRLPRAILPLKMTDGQLDLLALRDPAKPTDPTSTAGASPMEPPILWIDLKVPLETPAGEYQTTIEVFDPRSKQALTTLPVRLRVYDFVMPDERHLLMVSRLNWETLIQHYPDRMEAITPRLMNREDPRYKAAIRTMDQLITLAHAHRAQVVVPRLQPTVKWPANRPPQVDWRDFDSTVSPWLTGEMFGDKTPLGYWPLPQVDFLHNFDYRSQGEYWGAAAAHFDQRDWLGRSSVFLDKVSPGRASVAEAVEFSARMANILRAHPRIRVTSPLEEDQLVLSSEGISNTIDPLTTERLIAAAPGLVFAPPTQRWPENVTRPQRWLRTDLPGLVPYVGAGGDERDVRLWAWLAFLRQSGMILWDGVLPQNSSPAEPADPNQMIWFYPGQWFGVDEPVPTIQLKWLRRAQQDYEYLYLAAQRGEVINALVMARLITKPVQIQPFQALDPTYALMTGTADAQAWTDVRRLVARTILLREPGQPADPTRQSELYLETLRWLEPQERPTLLGRSLSYAWGANRAQEGNWVDVRLGVDLYNASDDRPVSNTLEFSTLPRGWMVQPQPAPIPMLLTFHVRREELNARFNVEETRAGRAATEPMTLLFTDGHKQTKTPLQIVVPVAASDRREGGLRIDGSIEDWTPEDSIQDGPLVEMLTRPVLQKQAVQPAATHSQVYTCWGGDHFYLAFRLTGVGDQDVSRTRNFIDYQFRRAWSEDLAQVLVQPIYDDNTLGPILHVAFKPNGADWVERKLDPKQHVDPWQPLEGSNIRYASTLAEGVWRGEVAIPWNAIRDPQKGMPKLLRFQFAQHNHTTGQSASWAGPVDHARDDAFTGLLYLREPDTPGMRR
jgi:hypothetical protein